MDSNDLYSMMIDNDIDNGIDDFINEVAKRHINFNADSNEQYVITLDSMDNLEKFYDDMESLGGDSNIPNRQIEVLNRRPNSRSTHYNISHNEAISIANDERVVGITRKKDQPSFEAHQIISNGRFNKSYNDINIGDINWGLLRHNITDNIPNWGDDASNQLNNWVNMPEISGGTPVATADVTITSTGKHVDVVIIDGHIDPNHPEFAVNPDGTGGSRVIQYNWLNSAAKTFVTGSDYTEKATLLNMNEEDVEQLAAYVYTPYNPDGAAGSSNYGVNHGCHVASTVAGNTHGWAKDANIYNFNPYSGNTNFDDNRITQFINYTDRDGNSGITSKPSAGLDEETMWDFIRHWHLNKPINPVTGRRNPTITNNSYGFGTTNIMPGRFWYIYGSDPSDWTTSTRLGVWGQYYPTNISVGGNRSSYASVFSGTSAPAVVRVKGNEFGSPYTSPENDVVFYLYGNSTDGFTHASNVISVFEPYHAYGNFPGPAGTTYTNLPIDSTWQGGRYGTGGTVDITIGSADWFFNSSVETINYKGSTFTRFATPPDPADPTNYGNFSTDPANPGTHGGLLPDDYKSRNVNLIHYRRWYYQHLSKPYPDTQACTINYNRNVGTTTNVIGYFDEFGASVDQAISEGIIVVHSAGNAYFGDGVSLTSDDQDNYFVSKLYFSENYQGVNTPPSTLITWNIYYNRLSGPFSQTNAIVVGALGYFKDDRKGEFSNTGSRVDIWAAGEGIQGTYQAKKTDGNYYSAGNPRNSRQIHDTRSSNTNYSQIKISGTSMASPQVAGYLACLAEFWPNITNSEAKDWLASTASYNKMEDWDYKNLPHIAEDPYNNNADVEVYFDYVEGNKKNRHSLYSAQNAIMRWYNQRPEDNNVFPTKVFKPRPTISRTYPRPRIRRRG